MRGLSGCCDVSNKNGYPSPFGREGKRTLYRAEHAGRMKGFYYKLSFHDNIFEMNLPPLLADLFEGLLWRR